MREWKKREKKKENKEEKNIRAELKARKQARNKEKMRSTQVEDKERRKERKAVRKRESRRGRVKGHLGEEGNCYCGQNGENHPHFSHSKSSSQQWCTSERNCSPVWPWELCCSVSIHFPAPLYLIVAPNWGRTPSVAGTHPCPGDNASPQSTWQSRGPSSPKQRLSTPCVSTTCIIFLKKERFIKLTEFCTLEISLRAQPSLLNLLFTSACFPLNPIWCTCNKWQQCLPWITTNWGSAKAFRALLPSTEMCWNQRELAPEQNTAVPSAARRGDGDKFASRWDGEMQCLTAQICASHKLEENGGWKLHPPLPRQKVLIVRTERYTHLYHCISLPWDAGRITRCFTMRKVKKENQNTRKASQIQGAIFLISL